MYLEYLPHNIFRNKSCYILHFQIYSSCTTGIYYLSYSYYFFNGQFGYTSRFGTVEKLGSYFVVSGLVASWAWSEVLLDSFAVWVVVTCATLWCVCMSRCPPKFRQTDPWSGTEWYSHQHWWRNPKHGYPVTLKHISQDSSEDPLLWNSIYERSISKFFYL